MSSFGAAAQTQLGLGLPELLPVPPDPPMGSARGSLHGLGTGSGPNAVKECANPAVSISPPKAFIFIPGAFISPSFTCPEGKLEHPELFICSPRIEVHFNTKDSKNEML